MVVLLLLKLHLQLIKNPAHYGAPLMPQSHWCKILRICELSPGRIYDGKPTVFNGVLLVVFNKQLVCTSMTRNNQIIWFTAYPQQNVKY